MKYILLKNATKRGKGKNKEKKVNDQKKKEYLKEKRRTVVVNKQIKKRTLNVYLLCARHTEVCFTKYISFSSHNSIK